MLQQITDFFSLSDPNVRYVVIGSTLLTASAAVVGTFTFLKKKALVGDAVAHSVLPGVCLAFLFSGTKNPLYLVLGAVFTGWLSLVFIDNVVARTKIKQDTAIGLTLSVFFGLGILLLTYIQQQGSAAQSGLDHFLFGRAAAIVSEDLITFAVIAVVLIMAVVLFFKEFTLIAFNAEYAHAIGLPVRRYELILTTLTVLAVVVGIQAVGVVLMAAMLITPAAAARFWTDRLRVMIVLAAIFGAVSGISGAYISYIAPAMPTGPWIVVAITTIAFVSFFFAPSKGILSRTLRQRKIRHNILDENILKSMYQIGEQRGDLGQYITAEELRAHRHMPSGALKDGLQRLNKQGYLEYKPAHWRFTPEGRTKGQRIVRLHRLWELYLTQYLNIAPDHVHEDAESIEHIITPEIESKLEKALDYPERDPHQSKIPYDS